MNLQNFLKRHGVYNAFADNLHKGIGGKMDLTVEEHEKLSTKEFKLISGAFDWEKSEEGKEFWRKIDTMWLELLNPEEEIPEYQTFKEFLKEINAEENYFSNAEEQLGEGALLRLPYLVPPCDWVRAGFDWTKTKEGGMLWAMTNVAWKMELTKHKHGG